MRSRIRALALLVLVSLQPIATAMAAEAIAPRLILITFDGVRWKEIFGLVDPELTANEPWLNALPSEGGRETPFLPYFWNEWVPRGVLIGDPRIGSKVTTSNYIGLSLPGYHSFFTGRHVWCFTNECGRPPDETFFERVMRELELPREDVAVFTTHRVILQAIEREPGTILSHGPTPSDDITLAMALAHLKTYAPRVLYIGLEGTDHAGHGRRYGDFLAALHGYDDWLRVLDGLLEDMGEVGEATTIVLTTDHGRGEGSRFPNHDWHTWGTGRIWLFARGPGIAPRGSIRGQRTYEQFDLRPTLELLLGLEPLSGRGRGRPIPELLPERGPGAR